MTAADGAQIAGNLAVSPKAEKFWTGWRTMKGEDGINLPRRITAIRGLATRLSNGDTLYVAENASALHSLNHRIRNAFVTVFGVILIIGIGSGLLVARSALRRVEAISETTRNIMSGDLSRRITLKGTGDEFDRLAENLNLMLARIQSLMENVQQVSNDIAHDLRSPLARLREHLELAAERTTDKATRSEIEESIAQVDSALEIFAAMLRIAEVEAGARRRDFNIVDLSTLLKDLADTFETVADAKSMNLSTDISDGLTLNGDRELLTQMFVNIIENAIHHSPSLSRIFIAAQSNSPGRSEVVISDNGPGIPVSEQTRVLKRFVKLDASRHLQGTGLGLALAVAVAELHNGRINLSGNDPGLRVVIALPLTR